MTIAINFSNPPIAWDYKPIPKSEGILLPKNFEEGEREKLCVSARNHTRNYFWIPNYISLSFEESKANAREHGFKGDFLIERGRAAVELELFKKYGGIFQQLFIDAEYGGLFPERPKDYSFTEVREYR